MSELFDKHRIFLVGGSGGVGKTTMAASLGLQLAERGYKTVVLTVDPARRLAQALGLEGFEKETQKVPLPEGQSLHASMLDSQRYFDKVISQFATSDEQRDKILNHRIYKVMVESLGGTNEYAAMERILEFSKQGEFEKIVVDTPPSHNAVDLFTAPQRLAEFMDNSVLKWFQGSQPLYLKLFQSGSKVALKLLRKIFGDEFLDAFTELMNALDGMQAGFKNRHMEILTLLKSQETAFFLVSRPQEIRFHEAVVFSKSLKEKEIQLKGLVVNWIEAHRPDLPEKLDSLSPQEKSSLESFVAYSQASYDLDQKWLNKFKQAFPTTPTLEVPRQEGALHELSTLSGLGKMLVNLNS